MVIFRKFIFALYALLSDIDDCENVACEHGGSCNDGTNNYTCSCVTGYTGQHCETGLYIPVVLLPDFGVGGGGFFSFSLDLFGCTSIFYEMVVLREEIRVTTEVPLLHIELLHPTLRYFPFKLILDIDDCENVTCEHGGSCNDGTNNYTCSCVAGYTGQHCETGTLNDFLCEDQFNIQQA